MPTALDPDRFELDPIDGWLSPDSRQLLFTVELADGSAKDISNDSLEWYLLAKPYASDGDAVVSGSDPGVEVRTDVVDPTAGESRVDIKQGTLTGEWGEYHQRVTVDPPDGSRQTWQGRVTLTDGD